MEQASNMIILLFPDAPPTQARSLQKRGLHSFRCRRIQGGFRQGILSHGQVRLRSIQEDSPPHRVSLPDQLWTPVCTLEPRTPWLLRQFRLAAPCLVHRQQGPMAGVPPTNTGLPFLPTAKTCAHGQILRNRQDSFDLSKS
ncbi:hypothetical protein MRX96_019710 [Rhipicephalus microplus]